MDNSLLRVWDGCVGKQAGEGRNTKYVNFNVYDIAFECSFILLVNHALEIIVIWIGLLITF